MTEEQLKTLNALKDKMRVSLDQIYKHTCIAGHDISRTTLHNTLTGTPPTPEPLEAVRDGFMGAAGEHYPEMVVAVREFFGEVG